MMDSLIPNASYIPREIMLLIASFAIHPAARLLKGRLRERNACVTKERTREKLSAFLCYTFVDLEWAIARSELFHTRVDGIRKYDHGFPICKHGAPPARRTRLGIDDGLWQTEISECDDLSNGFVLTESMTRLVYRDGKFCRNAYSIKVKQFPGIHHDREVLLSFCKSNGINTVDDWDSKRILREIYPTLVA